MDRMLDWRERLAGDKRIVAFTDDERHGLRWIVAICRSPRAVDSRFDPLWD